MAIFTNMLKNAGMTKGELATKLGLKAGTISSWKGDPPQYVFAYLEVCIENRQSRQTRAWIKKWLE